jgi:pimeloyl-ACP methyl ester carboxylesterase
MRYQPLVRRSIESCLASLRGQADLRFYTSAMAAQDVAQVLTALGYDQVNLFGGSYGASAARVFRQMFPARVRTMTLIGGTLLGIPLFERFPQASQQALDQVFARCASDPAAQILPRPSSSKPAPPGSTPAAWPKSPSRHSRCSGKERPREVSQRAPRPQAGYQRGGGCDAITFGRRPEAIWHYLARFVNRDVEGRRDSK